MNIKQIHVLVEKHSLMTFSNANEFPKKVMANVFILSQEHKNKTPNGTAAAPFLRNTIKSVQTHGKSRNKLSS